MARWLSLLILPGLTLLFFAELALQPSQTLYSDTSDLFAQHIPARHFLIRSWRETGELPLWCPSSFSGSPFVHDPQVGIFYPPNAILYLLPDEWVGAGLSWLIVGHLLLAGVGMYLYGRRHDFAPLSALVAALGFMFAGKWMLHLLAAGHYVTVGLAWLPWLLIAYESALKSRRWSRALLAGVVFALMILGTQPQWTFYAGLFVACWTLGTVLHAGQSWRERGLAIVRWGGMGALLVGLAVGLTAVQLLPTLEAARESTRSGGVPVDDVLPSGLRSLLFFLGPPLSATPTCAAWEDRGGFGLLWVVAAVLAPWLCRGPIRYRAAVCGVCTLFALGGAVLFQTLPGFNLFRQPSRMLLIVAFPVAYLAGATTQALFAGADPGEQTWSSCRWVLKRGTLALLLLAGGFALRLLLSGDRPLLHAYWAGLFVTVPLTFWLLRKKKTLATGWGWGFLLLVDLWTLALPIVQVRPETDVYPVSASLPQLAGPHRVLDRDVPGTSGTPLGTGAPLALMHQIEAVRGYNPLDNRRTREFYLLMGGEVRPLRLFEDVLAFPVVDNFPLRHKPLVDLLGVRYVLQPTAMNDDARWQLPGEGWVHVQEDYHATGYDFISGGLRPLPPYTLWENAHALPRAFVVPEARPWPDGSRLEALTTTDLRRCVLVEGLTNPQTVEPSDSCRPAHRVESRPNRVVVTATGPGWLVLTDVWYPGWKVQVDGEPAPLYRGDYLFRTTPLSSGEHEIVFTFEPASYSLGKRVSGGCLAALMGGAIVAILRRRRYGVTPS